MSDRTPIIRCAKARADMKADGSYQKLHEAYLNP